MSGQDAGADEQPAELDELLALGASAWRDADPALPSFGDVLEGPWLHDVHVRADTRMLGGGELPANLADKLAGWVNAPKAGEPITVLSQSFAPNEADRYALAHASLRSDGPWRAIVVSDTCHVFTCLGMRPKSSLRDRTYVAPIVDVPEATYRSMTASRPLGRMPLPPHDRVGAHPVAELRYAFAVDARTHRDHLPDATVHLQHERFLADFWAGFSTRRGALVTDRNLRKLAAVGEGGTEPSDTALDAMEPLAYAMDIARAIEENSLEQASDLAEALAEEAEHHGEEFGGRWARDRGSELATPLRQELLNTLAELRAATDDAIASLTDAG